MVVWSSTQHTCISCTCVILYSGKFGSGKAWRINSRSVNRLLIVRIGLDGFSLVNYGQFAKFAELYRYNGKLVQQKTFTNSPYEGH